MANRIKLKRSGTTGTVPTAASLEFGEIVINYADGILYYKKSDGTVGTISTGSGAQAGSGGSQARSLYETTATASQTTFSIPGGYPVGFIDVYLNGVALQTTDFTANNGTSVVLAEACIVGDVLKFITYYAASLVNAYTKAETDTLVNDQSIIAAIALG
jgi:hypothetical protein